MQLKKKIWWGFGGMNVTLPHTREHSLPSGVSLLCGPAASSRPRCCSSCSWTALSESSPPVASPPTLCVHCLVWSSSSAEQYNNKSNIGKMHIFLFSHAAYCESHLYILEPNGQHSIGTRYLLFLLFNFSQWFIQLLFLSLLSGQAWLIHTEHATVK